MEALIRKLSAYQDSLEDALRLESIPEEINETKDGKKLLKWLRQRRRVTNYCVRILSRF